VSPVKLRPGRARLSTSPIPIGSLTLAKTTGRVVPVRLAASVEPAFARFVPPVFDRDVLALDLALIPKAIDEGLVLTGGRGGGAGRQIADLRQLPRLLRLGDEAPRAPQPARSAGTATSRPA